MGFVACLVPSVGTVTGGLIVLFAPLGLEASHAQVIRVKVISALPILVLGFILKALSNRVSDGITLLSIEYDFEVHALHETDSIGTHRLLMLDSFQIAHRVNELLLDPWPAQESMRRRERLGVPGQGVRFPPTVRPVPVWKHQDVGITGVVILKTHNPAF